MLIFRNDLVLSCDHVLSFFLYLMLIHEIHDFDLWVEMNFQCMFLAVDSNPELCDIGAMHH